MSYYFQSASNQPYLLKEKESGLRWIADPGPPSLEALEEEIRELRSKMEQMYLEKLSFNNEAILEISRLLDDKIYQYLELDKGRNR
ncbi:aspartyl-phosphate phosphatase Spo0E family protein [Paenibacillus senegalensis]|uniref:aspartyl-phosphate phosphatase Spo0E family protein n=1 Tax=Paenibacillus senegalensis TaxID=1465766 RepID=UPI000289C1DE|nr:aspartyl-phosphate phosphatase Spo0E family protein [Paenibacillus senegalensis]